MIANVIDNFLIFGQPEGTFKIRDLHVFSVKYTEFR